jgi:general secretion pathway protein N
VKHRTGWLVALGVFALLVFALVTLPAAVLAPFAARGGLGAVSYGGSVWSGAAESVAWRGAPLGDLRWRLVPLALVRGRVAGHATLSRPDGSIDTDFTASFAGDEVRLQNATFDLPLAALDALPLGMPKGWRGRASGSIADLQVENRLPVIVSGAIALDGLVAPPPRNAAVGSFRAVFPHPQPQPSLSVPADPANVTAHVTDKDGPFSVDAQLTVSPTRNFALEGTLAPRGSVPPAVQQSLQLLGPADAAGRRQFSVGGTL